MPLIHNAESVVVAAIRDHRALLVAEADDEQEAADLLLRWDRALAAVGIHDLYRVYSVGIGGSWSVWLRVATASERAAAYPQYS
jgi:hypothetical protein